MSQQKSKCWTYFTKLENNNVKCQICSKILKSSGNTTNLNAHLKQKHNYVLDKCNANVASQLVSSNSDGNSIPMKKGKMVFQTQSDSQQQNNEVVSTAGPSTAEGRSMQPSIETTFKSMANYAAGGNKSIEISEAIAKFICKDNMAFHVVEGSGFKELMKLVCPLYKVPTSKTIKGVIERKYDVLSNALKDDLKLAKYFTLTTDIWTDIQMKSFLGVTVHFVSKSKLFSTTLGVTELSESHSAAYIGSQLLNILMEWQIEKENVVAVVTDNGANMVKAIYDTFGKNKHVPCFAHTLNLVCENSVKNTKGLNEILEKVRNIVIWFKRSVHASDELRKQQKDLGKSDGNTKKLILDVKTRWNSTFYMVQRFLEMVPIVRNIIFNNVSAPIMVTASEVEQLTEISKLLFPLEKMTKELSGEQYVTLSKVIPMLHSVLKEYSNSICCYEISINLKASLSVEFDRRFGQIEKSFLVAISTLLDPRFKQIHFTDPLACANIISFLKEEVTNFKPESNDTESETEKDGDSGQFDLWAHHNMLVTKKKGWQKGPADEVSQYISTPVCSFKQNPILVWDEMKSAYPHLYKVAEKFQYIVATSVPSERLFSKAGATATKVRNRLTGKRLSKLLFLNSLPSNYW